MLGSDCALESLEALLSSYRTLRKALHSHRDSVDFRDERVGAFCCGAKGRVVLSV